MTAVLELHRALGIERPAVFATVGGGGKTSLLFALAEEAAQSEGDHGLTALTTTTKMTVPPFAAQVPLVLGTNEAARAGALDDILRRGLPTAIVGSGRGDRERVLGVEASWPRAALAMPGVGLVGVEADGSAGRRFKAPAEHEPVIPDGVDVVAAVVGVQILGQPLNADHVHRPERVQALSGAEPETGITPELVATVLAHPEGGRKGVPDSAAFVVVITRVQRNPSGSQAIALACRAAGVTRVVAFDHGDGTLRSL